MPNFDEKLEEIIGSQTTTSNVEPPMSPVSWFQNLAKLSHTINDPKQQHTLKYWLFDDTARLTTFTVDMENLRNAVHGKQIPLQERSGWLTEMDAALVQIEQRLGAPDLMRLHKETVHQMSELVSSPQEASLRQGPDELKVLEQLLDKNATKNQEHLDSAWEHGMAALRGLFVKTVMEAYYLRNIKKNVEMGQELVQRLLDSELEPSADKVEKIIMEMVQLYTQKDLLAYNPVKERDEAWKQVQSQNEYLMNEIMQILAPDEMQKQALLQAVEQAKKQGKASDLILELTETMKNLSFEKQEQDRTQAQDKDEEILKKYPDMLAANKQLQHNNDCDFQQLQNERQHIESLMKQEGGDLLDESNAVPPFDIELLVHHESAFQ